MECVWSNGPAIKVRNSVFQDCAIMDLSLTVGTWWGQQPYTGVVVEDNVFYPSERTNNGGTHFYGFFINSVLPINGWTIRRNRFDQSVGVGSSVTNSTICGNTGSAPTSWSTPADDPHRTTSLHLLSIQKAVRTDRRARRAVAAQPADGDKALCQAEHPLTVDLCIRKQAAEVARPERVISSHWPLACHPRVKRRFSAFPGPFGEELEER